MRSLSLSFNDGCWLTDGLRTNTLNKTLQEWEANGKEDAVGTVDVVGT